MESTVNCVRCDSPLEMGDLRCAVCGSVPEEQVPARAGEELTRIVMRCGGCGAASRYDADARGLMCAFCGSVVEQEEVSDPLEQTRSYLPFSVGRTEARSALKSWLGSLGFFRPSDLTATARVEDLRPLWWVGWVFDADAVVCWAADSNAGSRSSAWAPHSGQVELVFDDVVVSASRGLSDDEAYAMTPSYDMNTAGEEPAGAEGQASIEEFDVQRSLARVRIMQGIDSAAAARVQQTQIPGTRFRKVHVVSKLAGLETRRVAFPTWVMAYRYKGELYRAVISGQDSRTVKGKAPYSWFKILAVVCGGIALVLLILAIAAAV